MPGWCGGRACCQGEARADQNTKYCINCSCAISWCCRQRSVSSVFCRVHADSEATVPDKLRPPRSIARPAALAQLVVFPRRSLSGRARIHSHSACLSGWARIHAQISPSGCAAGLNTQWACSCIVATDTQQEALVDETTLILGYCAPSSSSGRPVSGSSGSARCTYGLSARWDHSGTCRRGCNIRLAHSGKGFAFDGLACPLRIVLLQVMT